MKDNLLFTLLQSLNEREKGRFLLFLQSPYCNSHPWSELQILLVECLLSLADRNEISAEHVYSQVYREAKFDFGKFEKLKTSTVAALKNFLSEEKRLESESEERKQLRYAAKLRQAGLYNIFHSELKKIRANLFEKQVTQETLFDAFLLEAETGFFKSVELTKKSDANEPSIVQALDAWYLAQRFHYELSYWQSRIFADLGEPSPFFSREISRDLFDLYENQPELLQYYRRICDLFRVGEPAASELFAVFSDLKKVVQIVPSAVARDWVTSLSNYLSREVARGKEEFYSFLFEVQRFYVETGLVYYEGKIHSSDLTGILTVALRVENNLDWCEKFVTDHEKLILNREKSVEMFRFAKAIIFFHKQEYPQVRKLLWEDFTEQQYKILAKLLELKTLAMTGNPEIDAKLGAAKIFFFREKNLPPERKKACSRFVDFLTRLSSYRTEFNKKRLEKILEEIKSETVLAEKHWLLSFVQSKITQSV